MPTQICSNCQTDTETVVDHKAGQELCSRCGLVLVINLFDEIPERQNSPDSVENGDETKNPVSEIENCSGYNSNDQKIAKNQSKKGFEYINVMADGLGLTTRIKDRACEIYGKVDIMKTCRGRSISSIAAACLFIACKEIGSSRTLNEISAVAPDGVSKKNINRTAEAIKKQLEVESWILQPGEFIRRLCLKLGLENRAIKAVQEAVERAQHLDIRRSPKSVLAAIIYMVIQLCQREPVPVKDIAMVMEVTEVTIKKSFKDISVYAAKVIPDWYAGEEDVHKIPYP